MRTAAGDPSIVTMIEEKNGLKKWEGRSPPWKTMTRLQVNILMKYIFME
jgi:hypothetical protein